MLSPTVAIGDAARGESASLPAKLVKKRKSVAVSPDDHLPSAPALDTVASPSDLEPPQSTLSRAKSDASKRLKRSSSRLHRKLSRSSISSQGRGDDEGDVVVVVRPGDGVPPVPVLPAGVEGNKVRFEGEKGGNGEGDDKGDDGYGGLGHEIF